MNLRNINLVFSIATICILLIDFLVTETFTTERGFLDVFILFLILNIGRLIFWNKRPTYWIALMLNIGLLGFLCYCILILALLLFGIGFRGSKFPIIMGFAIIVNIGFIGVLIADSFNLIKLKVKWL